MFTIVSLELFSFPFAIPKNWCWTTLPSVASVELGKTLDKAKNTGSYHPYLRSVNVQWGYIDLSDLNEMKFEEHEIDKYSIKRNDLLICEGGDVGRCCIWEINDTFLYQNALHRVRFYADLEPRFYLYVMMLYESLGILKNISTGVTIKHLTGNVLSAMPVPLPPLSEQKRIVEAIEGGDIGRSAIWMFDEDIRIQNHIHRLRPYTSLSNRFYYYVMFMWKQMGFIGGQGIGLQGFSSKALHNLLVPLPPEEEQIKIAAFVDNLFETITNIEKSLS